MTISQISMCVGGVLGILFVCVVSIIAYWIEGILLHIQEPEYRKRKWKDKLP